MKKLLIFFLSLFALLGCIRQVTPKTMIGKYCLNRASGRDSIYIYDNQTYVHRFYALNHRVFECKGNWEINKTVNSIKFKNFIFFTDAGRDGLPSGDWDSKIETSSGGKVRLIYSSEDDIYFEKE
jgi:hypothetical protein